MAVRGFEDWDGKTGFVKDKLPWLFRLLWEKHGPGNLIRSAEISELSSFEWVNNPNSPDPDRPIKKIRVSHKGLQPHEIRSMVNYFRKKLHFPIISGKKGYAWARTPEDIEDTILHMKDRVTSIQAAVDGLKNANFMAYPGAYGIDITDNQKSLFDDFDITAADHSPGGR